MNDDSTRRTLINYINYSIDGTESGIGQYEYIYIGRVERNVDDLKVQYVLRPLII